MVLFKDLRTLSENPATFQRVNLKVNYQLIRHHPAALPGKFRADTFPGLWPENLYNEPIPFSTSSSLPRPGTAKIFQLPSLLIFINKSVLYLKGLRSAIRGFHL